MSPQNKQEEGLQRCFGLREAVTITTGTVIGVGLFTVGANVTGQMGPQVILATLAALAISIYPALLYGEMGAALPWAGGTYQYAALGLGRPWGMLAGWCFVISLVSVASGEALAFSFYCRTLFDALGLPLPLSDTALACLVVAIFLLCAVGGVRMTGRLQNGFLFFFWGVALVWFLLMLPHIHLDFLTGRTGGPPMGFLGAVALIWWCFAGFETCCAMGEEIRFPQINLPRALFLAPWIVFAVTALFQWVLLGIVPSDSLPLLATADAPYAQGMALGGVLGLPLILLALGIAFGGDLSTLNASMAAPARYLFTMARDGALPPFLARLHPRFRTPHWGILILGALTILLISTGSLLYIASLSLFATLLYYIIGIAAAWGLRRKQPDLPRSYRAPLIQVGAPVSIAVFLLMLTQLAREAVITGLLWCALGLIIFFFCSRRYTGATAARQSPPEPPAAPSPAEQQRLDRQYRRWRGVVILAVLGVLALYLVPHLC